MELTEAWFQRVIDEELEGVELVLLEEAGSRRHKILRLYIDYPGGVTHDLCARVSGVLGAVLDEVDAFDGTYSLEVSSPGIERPLRKREHFEAQIGNKVYVNTSVSVGGTKVWRGELVQVSEDAIVVREAGREARILLSDVKSAHLVYEFKQGVRE